MDALAGEVDSEANEGRTRAGKISPASSGANGKERGEAGRVVDVFWVGDAGTVGKSSTAWVGGEPAPMPKVKGRPLCARAVSCNSRLWVSAALSSGSVTVRLPNEVDRVTLFPSVDKEGGAVTVALVWIERVRSASA
jgi:hypothetical protein